jgi:6-phosphogluconolactonase
MVIAQGQFMYVGYPGLGQIYAYSIASDGSLTAISGSPFSVAYLLNSTVGGSQAMIANPAGTLFFVLNPSANQLYVYSIGSDGSLTQTGSPLTLPFEPLNLATDGLGKYLYVSNSNGVETNEIAAYSIGSTGTLTAVPNSPFISNGQNLNFALAQMQGDSSGKYMIGTTSSIISSDPHLYVLAVASDGELSPLAGSPFPTTSSPSFVTVQPDAGGTLIYSITVNDAAVGGFVEGYQLDPTTGTLTADSGSPFGVTGDYAQFDQAGTFLFVRDIFNKAMDVYTVGTAGTLTTPTATIGWGPGSWAPTDIP